MNLKLGATRLNNGCALTEKIFTALFVLFTALILEL
jgi:hypothetical protein